MTVTYYSRSAGLTFGPPELKGKIVDTPQGKQRIDEKIISFTPMGNSQYGSYTTDDPDIITALENRARTAGDIMTATEYAQSCIPIEKRLADAQREIKSANRLLDILKEQRKIKPETATFEDALQQVEAKVGAPSK